MFLKLQKKITAKLQNHVAVHSGTLSVFDVFDSLKIARQGRFCSLLIFICNQLSFVLTLTESFKKTGLFDIYCSVTMSGSVFGAHVT